MKCELRSVYIIQNRGIITATSGKFTPNIKHEHMNIDERNENDQKGISRPHRIKAVAVINISQHKYLILYIETAKGNKSSESELIGVFGGGALH